MAQALEIFNKGGLSPFFFFLNSILLFSPSRLIGTLPMQETDSMSKELSGSSLATPLQETNIHPEASAAPGDSPQAPGSQPLNDHDGEKVADIFENINKETIDCELGELPEKLEALPTTAEITPLPYSKLIPLMIGLCAGMLLSSMDSVSEYEVLPNTISIIELTVLLFFSVR